jgi:nitric oxide reductase activation protein
MTPQPQLSADDLRNQLQQRFEQLCIDIAAAVNQAPAGHVLNASEQRVRDLCARFRQQVYQAAVQARLDAAQAAFPPSAGLPDRTPLPEQGA